MVLAATCEANCKNQEVLESRTFTFQNYTEQSLNSYAKCLVITEIFRNHFMVKIIFLQYLFYMVYPYLLSESYAWSKGKQMI